MCTNLVNKLPTLPKTVNTMSIYFSDLWLYSHKVPYLEMPTDHVNITPTLSRTVYIMSIHFFSFSPDFLAIFPLLTIFGNVHRPCKQYSNIINNILHHVYFFSSAHAVGGNQNNLQKKSDLEVWGESDEDIIGMWQ